MSICNYCENCVGRCSWSKNFVPVEGWKAEPSYVKRWDGEKIDSYNVKECPQFIDYREGQ